MKKLFALVVIFSLGACASAGRKHVRGSYVLLGANKVAPVQNAQASSVEVFYEKEPGIKVTEVGIVEAFAEGRNVGLNDLLPELQRQAAGIGAKGVYKIKIQRFNHAVEAIHATGIAFIEKAPK